MRRLVATGVWLLATVAATVMVWSAVSVVAADVTDRPAPVVAHRDVVSALHSGQSGTTAPLNTAVPPGTTTGAGAPPGTSAVLSPAAKASPPATGRVPPFTPFTAPPTTAVPAVTTPPTTKVAPRPVPTTTTTAAPKDPSATYSTAGGVATVACHGDAIRLVSATANDGYTARPVSSGPPLVVVDFDGTPTTVINAACFLGQPIEAPGSSPPPTAP